MAKKRIPTNKNTLPGLYVDKNSLINPIDWSTVQGNSPLIPSAWTPPQGNSFDYNAIMSQAPAIPKWNEVTYPSNIVPTQVNTIQQSVPTAVTQPDTGNWLKQETYPMTPTNTDVTSVLSAPNNPNYSLATGDYSKLPINPLNPASQVGKPTMTGLEKMDVGIKGLTALGNLWANLQGMKQTKNQNEFNKQLSMRNLSNTAMAYNTNMEGQYRRAAEVNGTNSTTQDQYVKDHKISGVL